MASSFHLYANEPITRWDAASVILRVLEKPTVAQIVYWAMQMTFRQTDDTVRGGAHCGFQVGASFANAGKTGCNWGGYDDIIGGGANYRGTISALGYGYRPNSPNFVWSPGVDYLLKVFKSPTQNHLAAALNTGGDQVASEIAWRFTITNLATGTVTTVRDILVPNCATSNAISDLMVWTEDFNTATPPTATVPHEVRWSEPRVNDRLCPTVTLNYNTGGDSLTNTNTYLDKIGWRQKTVVTRTTATNDVLTHPGAVVRSWSQHSLAGSTASATITVTTPAGATSTDRLYAVVTTDWNQTLTIPSGWQVVVDDVGSNTAGPRLSVLSLQLTAAPAANYTFTNSASSNTFAVIMLAIMGADVVVPGWASVGTASGADSTTWNAPLLARATNYARVILIASVRPAGSGVATTFGTVGGPIALSDTNTISSNWITVAVAEEATPGLTDAVAKTGTLGNGHNVGMQIMISPALQRLSPSSDVSAGTWTPIPASPTTLYDKVDETGLPDNADKIIGLTGSAVTLALAAGTLTDPNTTVGYVLRYTLRRQNANTGTVLIEVLDTATVIASKTETVAAGDAFVEGTLTLSGAEAASFQAATARRVRATPTLT